MIITLHIHPRAKETRVEQIDASVFNVWLTSAPHDGEANEQLLRVLAKHLSIAKSRIRLVRGLRSRTKTVEIL